MIRTSLSLLAAMTLVAGVARAEQHVGTLTLDGLSYLSFENVENLGIPAGSTIRFHFEAASASGSIGFTIAPADVAVPNIPLPGGRGEMAYGLAEATSGTMTKKADGFEIQFNAAVHASRLPKQESSGGSPHLLSFTTGSAQASSQKTADTIQIDGLRVVPGARYVQLVGAVTNPAHASPHPGKAVATVLSGTFDWLPTLE